MFNLSAPTASLPGKNHLQARMTFFIDFSQKMIDGVQKLSALNIQVAKTVLDESVTSSKMLMASKNGSEAFTVLASLAKPSLQKMQAYRQHVQHIAADTQADVVKSFQSHLPKTTRTIDAIGEDVTKQVTEVAATAAEVQREAVEQLATAAKQNVDRAVIKASK